MARRARRRAWGSVRQFPSRHGPGRGRWQASYIGPDLRRHKGVRTFPDRLGAERWLGEERRLIDRDEWTPPAERESARWAVGQTVAEYGAAWIEQRSLRPRTASLYTSQWTRLVEPTLLGAMALRALTPAHLRAWHASLDHTLATQTKQVYSLLKSVMTTAVNDGVLQSNPCNLTGKAVAVPKRRSRKMLQPDEVAKIADAEVMPDRYRVMVLLAAWAGLRWGEVSELRRCDVAVDGSVVAITRGVVHRDGKCIIAGTKTDATRTVTVPPHVQPDLVAHMATHVADDDGALLFTPTRGGGCGHVKDRVFSKEWFDKATKAVGVEGITFHGLRHFAGTSATLAGGSIRDVMTRLGHTTHKAAMFYQAVVEGRDAEIADALSKLASPLHGADAVAVEHPQLSDRPADETTA